MIILEGSVSAESCVFLGCAHGIITRLDVNEFTKTNFVFLLISLERILDQNPGAEGALGIKSGPSFTDLGWGWKGKTAEWGSHQPSEAD